MLLSAIINVSAGFNVHRIDKDYELVMNWSEVKFSMSDMVGINFSKIYDRKLKKRVNFSGFH